MSRKAFTLAQDIPWAITEAGLRQILLIANRENLDVEAVEAQLGRKLANTQSVTERDGVAIIALNGPIVRYANLFSAISGATSIELLARDFNAALNNSSIRAILFNVDSPGGEVNGTDEFTAMVYAARGVKPIYAYIGGAGCSAAYWIASACEQVVCGPTAILGSIGIIATVPNPDAELADDIAFVSSQSPYKNPDPRSDEGKSSIQATIDSLAQVFVETVARNRGVSAKTVLDSFGQGGVFVGAEAVAAGLADRVGSFEGVLARLAGKWTETTRVVSHASSMDLSGASITRTVPVSRSYVGITSSGAEVPLIPRLVPSAPNQARLHIPQAQEQSVMADEPLEEQVQPALPPITPPTFSASDPAVAAQVNAVVAQMTAQFEQQRQIVLEQAQAQFQRQLAEMQAQQAIQTYAQHITTPTMQRPHALPFTSAEVVTFLSSLNPEQRKGAQGMFDRLLDSGLVSFEELGSSGEGAETQQSAKEQFDAAVQAKVASGMSRLAAMQAVQREQPTLYAEYRNEGGVAKKGGR